MLFIFLHRKLRNNSRDFNQLGLREGKNCSVRKKRIRKLERKYFILFKNKDTSPTWPTTEILQPSKPRNFCYFK